MLPFSLGACASGNAAQNAESTEAGKGGTSAESGAVDKMGYSEPVTIKVGFGYDDTVVFAQGQDATHNDWVDLYADHNILLDVLYDVDASQADAKLSTAIMSGVYPDILKVNATDYKNYIANGVISPIDDDLEMYASDELKAYLGLDGGEAVQRAKVDGKLYGIPDLDLGYDSVPMLFIRKNWLENLGLDVPETLEDFKKVAHAFTYNDPDGDGVNNTYGLAVNGVDVLGGGMGELGGFFESFGAYPGKDAMTFMDDGNGNAVWGGDASEEMKAALTALKEMYADGSLTNEFITMDSNSVFEEAGSARCGMWFAPMWGAMIPQGNSLKKDINTHIIAVPLPDFTGTGNHKTLLNPNTNNYFCVSSKCENPEVLIKLLNLAVEKLDPDTLEEYRIYKDGDLEHHTGFKTCLTVIEKPDKNYDNYLKDTAALESGDTSELNSEQLNDYEHMKTYLDAVKAGTFDPENGDMSTGAQLYTVFGDPEGGYAVIDQLVKNDGFVKPIYGGFVTDTMAEVQPTLIKLTEETIVKIMTGDPVDSYDTFLQSWHALGGDDVIAEAQEWVEANR